MQKGFAPIIILIGILVLAMVAGGAYYFLFLKQAATPVVQPSPSFNTAPQYKNINVQQDVQNKVNQANDSAVKMDLDNLQQALDSYKQRNGIYPTSLQVLTQAGFLRTVPTNPYTNDIYDYQSDSKSYILKGKLGNGNFLQVSK